MRPNKRIIRFALGCLLLGGAVFGQDRPILVSPIQLIANPEKYENKTVTVKGYLVFSHEKGRVIATFLYLHEEDARNLLPNEITVVSSEQMLRDEEKLDRKYVALTGVSAISSPAGGSSGCQKLLTMVGPKPSYRRAQQCCRPVQVMPSRNRADSWQWTSPTRRAGTAMPTSRTILLAGSIPAA